MITTSEIAVTATIWALTAVGGFFSVSAYLRRKKTKCDVERHQTSKPAE